MRSLDIHEGRVIPTPEALAVPVISALYERDNTKHKENAFKALCYVTFMTDPRKANPYIGLNEEDRATKLQKEFLGGKKPDKLIKDAVEWWREYWATNIPEIEVWRDAQSAATSLMDYLKNVDYDERTRAGSMVHNPSHVASTLAKVSDILQQLNSLGRKIQEEAFDIIKSRGGRDINPLER